MREAALQDHIRLALDECARELTIWRNACGFDAAARQRYGIGNPGGADLIGMWTHADGRAQFVGLEIKTPVGRQSPEQKAFQALVVARGGVYAVLRSVEEAKAWAERMRELEFARVRADGGCTCRSASIACPLHSQETSE